MVLGFNDSFTLRLVHFMSRLYCLVVTVFHEGPCSGYCEFSLFVTLGTSKQGTAICTRTRFWSHCTRLSIFFLGRVWYPGYPFVNHKGKDVNSDWLADQLDERSILGQAQLHKGRMTRDDPETNTVQIPKRLDRCLALWEKIRETFTDSIPNKSEINHSLTG